jgi:hypothetical protein
LSLIFFGSFLVVPYVSITLRFDNRGLLHLLRTGKGTGPLTFDRAGWTFRTPPVELGDFPLLATTTRRA